MKKRRYADLYGYTQDEFDRWLEKGINKKLRSARKPRSEHDMHTVFAAYKDETRELLAADSAKCVPLSFNCEM